MYGLIETPRSLTQLNNYMDLIDKYKRIPRVIMTGFIFGAEDYASLTGITRSPSLLEMTYARQHIVAAAKSKGLQCIDLVQPSTCLTDDIGIY